jgi:hypothetical protein
MNRAKARWTLVTLTLALTITSFLYRSIVLSGYGQTGLMFIGIPFALSLILIFSPPGKSPRTIVIKGTTLFLLMTGILLWEGIICILMAAPIFYAVALISVAITERFLKKNPPIYCCGIVAIALLSTEGIHEFNSWNRFNSITATKSVHIEQNAFEEQLERGPLLDESVPLFFKLGFPTPEKIGRKGTVLNIRFSGPTDLENELVVKAYRLDTNTMEYRFLKDSTKVGHWLRWDSAILDWTRSESDQVDLNLTINYTRKLDPIWYFGPLQKFAVGKTADYLLETWFDENTRD